MGLGQASKAVSDLEVIVKAQQNKARATGDAPCVGAHAELETVRLRASAGLARAKSWCRASKG